MRHSLARIRPGDIWRAHFGAGVAFPFSGSSSGVTGSRGAPVEVGRVGDCDGMMRPGVNCPLFLLLSGIVREYFGLDKSVLNGN